MKKIKNIILIIWNEFIYGGHLLSLGAVSIVYTAAVLLRIKITLDFLVIIYLGIYTSYLYNRYKELNRDFLTNPDRVTHLKKYIKYIPSIIVFFSSIIIGIILYSNKIQTILFAIFLLFFSFFYTIFLKKITKKIVALKDLFVSFCWASMIVLLALYYSYPINTALFLFFLLVFMVLFVNVNFCNIKDTEGDKKEGLLTLAVVLGRKKLITVLSIIILLSAVPIIYGYYFNLFPKVALMLLLIIPYTFYYFNKAAKEKTNLVYLTHTLVYGEYILWSVFIYIGKILF